MRRLSHRFALLAAAFLALTIFVGEPLEGRIIGLAVPEWPNTYGHFLLPSPLSRIAAGSFWEGLRWTATLASGLITLGLAWWIFRVETRAWVRRAALAAAAVVMIEALLIGGGAILPALRDPAVVLHGTLAALCFCSAAAIAAATSEEWIDEPARARDAGRPDLRTLAAATTVVLLGQMLLGAIVRHAGAGLAIPDVPTIYGGWIPPLSEERLAAANRDLWENGLLWKNGFREIGPWQIIANLLHRLGALASALMAGWTVLRVRRAHSERPDLSAGQLLVPAHVLLILFLVQITLGILTILTRRQIEVASAHALTGTLALGASLVLALRARHLLAGGEGIGSDAVSSIPDEVTA